MIYGNRKSLCDDVLLRHKEYMLWYRYHRYFELDSYDRKLLHMTPTTKNISYHYSMVASTILYKKFCNAYANS